MPWWLELILGFLLILGPLSQMKSLGQVSWKVGPDWGKSSPWTLPLFLVYIMLMVAGSILCLAGWLNASAFFHSIGW